MSSIKAMEAQMQTILLFVVIKLLWFKWNLVLLLFSTCRQILYLCSKGQD